MGGQGSEAVIKIGNVELLDALEVTETIKGLARRGKLWMFEQLFGAQWWADLFGVIQEADSSTCVTVSPSGIVYVIKDYLYRTVDIGAIVGEEIGSEGIMEMLSEGLSSALETNFNGSLQSILNVWKGALPADLSHASGFGRILDRAETYFTLSQIMTIGNLNYVTLGAMYLSADERLREAYTPLREYHSQLISLKNEAMTKLITELVNFLSYVINDTVLDAQNFVSRIESYVQNVAEASLARVNQIEASLDSDKARYDIGIIGEDEFNKRLNEYYIDLNTEEQLFSDYMSSVDSMISDYANLLDSIADELKTLIKDYLASIESHINAIANKVADLANNIGFESQLKSKLLELYNKLKAYRQSGFDYS